MELRQLRTFEAVVRHRTVTDAANALGLAPSSVSAQIRALEDSLGVKVFERGARGMALTAPGERLVVHARMLLDQAEQARAEVTGRAVELRLGALQTIVAALVPGVLARLAARRPALRVEVHAATDRDGLLADVAAGRLEAALLLDTGDALGDLGFAPPPEPLTFLDVEPVPLALVAAPAHRLADRSGLAVEDLVAERLLTDVPACSFHLAADHLFGPALERVRAGGVPVMRAWAERGLGLALLPEFAVADALAAGTLVRLALPVPDLGLRLVWRGDREALPGLRDVLYAAIDERTGKGAVQGR